MPPLPPPPPPSRGAQHPARDAHDTFFLTHPATSDTFPEDYLQRVKVWRLGLLGWGTSGGEGGFRRALDEVCGGLGAGLIQT